MPTITKISGKDSQVMVEVGSTPTALVTCSDWTLNTSRGSIDVSSIGTEWKEYLPGQVSSDGSVTLIFDPTNDTVAEAIESAMFAGTLLTFHIRPQGTGSGNENYELDAYVTGWNMSAATEDALKVALTFQGSGAITKTSQS